MTILERTRFAMKRAKARFGKCVETMNTKFSGPTVVVTPNFQFPPGEKRVVAVTSGQDMKFQVPLKPVCDECKQKPGYTVTHPVTGLEAILCADCLFELERQ